MQVLARAWRDVVLTRLHDPPGVHVTPGSPRVLSNQETHAFHICISVAIQELVRFGFMHLYMKYARRRSPHPQRWVSVLLWVFDYVLATLVCAVG